MDRRLLLGLMMSIGGCTSVYTPTAPLTEPEYYKNYGAVSGEVYPAAYNDFVDSTQLVGAQPFHTPDASGVALKYTTSVSAEVVDVLLKSLANVNSAEISKFCNTTGGGSLAIPVLVDGKEIVISPIQTAVYPVDTIDTKGRYDLIGFNPEVCSGGALQWVYIDTAKTRNFPFPLYSPDVFHIYKNGRFFSEITPGFIPGVSTENKVEAYGLFLHLGSHEITAFYPDTTKDLTPQLYIAKKESASFN